MNEKLKPCPFCGGEADAMYTYSVADCKFYIVKCLQCGIETPFKHTEEESNATPSKSRDFEELFMRFMRICMT